MNGLSDLETVLSSVCWSDAELQSITIDYEVVRLRLRETTGIIKEVIAKGYIGYWLVGFWDEIVVDRAEISLVHPSIERCKDSIRMRLGENPLETGSNWRNNKNWYALLLYMSDGAVVEIVATGLQTEIVT